MSGKDLPELSNASLDWSRAGFDLDREALYEGVTWRRIIAFFIDVAIISVLLTALWAIVLLSWGLLSGLLTLMPLVPVIYHTLLIASRRSATLGMQFMGIEVRSQSGERPAILQAFAMTALFYLSVSVTGTLILIIALFNDQRRCAHDILSGTSVVNTHAEL